MADDYKAALTRSRKAAPSLETRTRVSWLRGVRGVLARSVARRPWPPKK